MVGSILYISVQYATNCLGTPYKNGMVMNNSFGHANLEISLIKVWFMDFVFILHDIRSKNKLSQTFQD
jgi:hypothetical protein